jgi:ribosomal protein S28E/S33
METLIPILGILTGMIIPVSVFAWLYLEGKDKNRTILEISKNLDDPSKLEDMLRMLEDRKKEPIDYRRGGVVTVFVGIGIYLLGNASLGSFFEGIGLLVGAIGVGTMIAGYLYPNTGEELTNAVEDYEKK